MSEVEAVVIDNGSGVCKAGFAGNDEPVCVFPSVVGYPRFPFVMPGVGPKPVYFADEAFSKRGALTVSYPKEHGMVVNWDDMEKLWHHTFFSELRIAPEYHPILLTEPPLTPKAHREKTFQIMFENFNTPGVYIAQQPLLALCTSSRSTGVVVESGDGATHITPIYQGTVLTHAIQRSDLAGRELTQHLANLLKDRKYFFYTSSELEVVRDIKEKLTYVSIEMTGASEKCYTLPDGQTISLANERFKCPEALFRPSLVGLEHPGIHESVHAAIEKCDSDIRTELYRFIRLSGGTTRLPGFGDRLRKELQTLAAPMDIGVVESPPKEHTVWLGGSMVACLSSFQDLWVTREEFEELGSAYVYQKYC